MADVYISFPVTCPICGTESLTAFRAETIIDCLDSHSPLPLSSTCHDAAWVASAVEEEQVREYLFLTIGFTRSSEPWMAAFDRAEAGAGKMPDFKRDPNPPSRS